MKKITIHHLLSFLILSACGSKNSDRQAPPEFGTSLTIEGEQTKLVADPKVNVLFVVDNSGSMKSYQEKLAKNMRLFSKKFFSQSRIDYRIGVVPIYDSKYLNDKTMYESGLRKMNPLGELVQLKGLDPSFPGSKLYITRDTPNPMQVLEKTVAIGTQWGPEAEESFSPVLAVTNSEINSTKNQNFYIDDAYLAVIFLTDADDVTPGLSGEEFYQKLVDLKKGDRSKVLIAAALPNLNDISEECTKDGRGPLQSFPAMLAVSGAIFADLCSETFGNRLADFSQYLVLRVAEQRIALNFSPDISTLVVSYGLADSKESERMVIPRGPGGYLFDSDRNEVIISAEINLEHRNEAVIFVRATPANLANGRNGRLNQL